MFALDGEIVIPAGRAFSFDALLQRIHPAASRVQRLAAETPAIYVDFDLVAAEDGRSLLTRPLRERRNGGMAATTRGIPAASARVAYWAERSGQNGTCSYLCRAGDRQPAAMLRGLIGRCDASNHLADSGVYDATLSRLAVSALRCIKHFHASLATDSRKREALRHTQNERLLLLKKYRICE
jgi:hypothetical protein